MQMKVTPLETAVEEENELLRCIQELKSELSDLREDKALTPSKSIGDQQSQLTEFEEQRVVREKLEAQTSAMTQLQQQMLRIEQLCVKLSSDLNALAAKV